MNKVLISLLCLSILFSGNAYSKKKYYAHPEHGKVKSKNKIVKKDQKECGDLVYKDGLEIDGKKYTDRKEIIRFLINRAMRSSGREESPSWWDEYMVREKEYNACFQSRGWKIVK